MKRYRYCCRTADDVGEHRHPQLVIRELFPDAHDFEPAPIGDCWLFTASSSSFDEPPSYIEEVKATGR